MPSSQASTNTSRCLRLAPHEHAVAPHALPSTTPAGSCSETRPTNPSQQASVTHATWEEHPNINRLTEFARAAEARDGSLFADAYSFERKRDREITHAPAAPVVDVDEGLTHGIMTDGAHEPVGRWI